VRTLTLLKSSHVFKRQCEKHLPVRCRDRGNSRSFFRSSVHQAQSFKPNSSSIEPIELFFIAYIHEKLVMAF